MMLRKRFELQSRLVAEELERRVATYVEERVAAVLSSDAVQRELQTRLERERRAIEEQVRATQNGWERNLVPLTEGKNPDGAVIPQALTQIIDAEPPGIGTKVKITQGVEEASNADNGCGWEGYANSKYLTICQNKSARE